jgi:hypothetical protein
MDAYAREWIAAAAARHGHAPTGELALVKQRPWATVMRVGTSAGDFYFKENAPGGRHEPALVSALAREWPDRVAPPLAVEVERGWLLTRDLGRRLGDGLDAAGLLAAWERLLPRYAEIQIGSAREPGRWLGLGVPDRRLDVLPALTGDLLRGCAELTSAERSLMFGLLPELEARCRELAATPGASALEHGDLHAGNVLVGRAGPWLFDWADASVSHPFCSLLVNLGATLEDIDTAQGRRAAARLVDAYLEPWSVHAPARALRPLVSAALWIAHAGRALDWDRMLAGADADARASWQPQIASWLRSWVDRLDWSRSGAWP